MRILIVEDDGLTADLLIRGLRDLSHDVAHVATGSAAIRAVAERQFEVAVVDRLLPDDAR